MTECGICLDRIDEGTYKILSCSHKFHTKCIIDWFRRASTCPCCRNNNVENFDGISVIDHRKDEGYVTPVEAAGEDKVYVSRIRHDNTVENLSRIPVVKYFYKTKLSQWQITRAQSVLILSASLTRVRPPVTIPSVYLVYILLY